MIPTFDHLSHSHAARLSIKASQQVVIQDDDEEIFDPPAPEVPEVVDVEEIGDSPMFEENPHSEDQTALASQGNDYGSADLVDAISAAGFSPQEAEAALFANNGELVTALDSLFAEREMLIDEVCKVDTTMDSITDYNHFSNTELKDMIQMAKQAKQPSMDTMETVPMFGDGTVDVVAADSQQTMEDS